MAVVQESEVKVKDVELKEARAEETKFTMIQAIGLNTMNMFGTGPLITIPYCLASVEPMGPHAIIGYGIAALACMMDSFVWAELGSMFPYNGGPIVYLTECFGRDTWGKFVGFMFVWQFLITGPAEVASGFIAIAEYLAYFSPDTVAYGGRVGISLALTVVSVALLYRKVSETGKVVTFLWAITIFAMIYTFALGFSGWNGDNLVSKNLPTSGGGMVWALAAATKFGVYDMTGYYDVNSMGDEVQNPKRTIPVSVIATCYVVGFIYVIIYIAIVGTWPWQEYIQMYTDDFEGTPIGIMSVITELKTGSRALAGAVTVLVSITIFGSTFAQLCGYTYLLQAAGSQGYFFKIFGHMHAKHEGLADYALLMIGGISCAWCFFSLDQVIEAMGTLLVFVQFGGQSVGLMYFRYRTMGDPTVPEGWRMPFFPIPCVFQLAIFSMIFITSDSIYLWGSENPTLELSVVFLLLGCVMFLARQANLAEWPFENKELHEIHAMCTKMQAQLDEIVAKEGLPAKSVEESKISV